MKNKLFLLFLALFPLFANAEKVQIDGIWYNLIEKAKQAEVTWGTNYTGKVIIPEVVTHEDVVYDVTSIGEKAFYACSLTDITIPNSVTNIELQAFSFCSELKTVTNSESLTCIKDRSFEGCSSLSVITIPESVTDIGVCAFEGCASLTDVTLPNSLKSISDYLFRNCLGLTTINIPENITSIGRESFKNCSNLATVIIPNSVMTVGSYAFYGCSKLTDAILGSSITELGGGAFGNCICLTEIAIPNSLTTIKFETFYGCTELSMVKISGSVTKIEDNAFYGCNNLTEVVLPHSLVSIGRFAFAHTGLIQISIPNSVTIVGNNAFYNCTNLVDVKIGNSVKTITDNAFASCKELTDVYCLAEEVPSTTSDAFADSYIEYATLHVPASVINDYKATAPWSGFGTIKSISEGEEEEEVKKCATPTISYQSGKLTFACETEGVEYISEITGEDIKKHYEAEVLLTATYTVSVYATKAEYENSETATATLCWVECTENHEGEEGNGVINIPSTPVLIQSQAGAITLTGLTDGTPVSVYSTDGKEAGNGVATNQTTTVQTSVQTGNIAIVKIGAKSVKVVMK